MPRRVAILLLSLLIGISAAPGQTTGPSTRATRPATPLSRPTTSDDGSQILRTELARRSEMAIRRGVKFLLSRQTADGSWETGSDPDYEIGATALVTLALLSCGESHQSPAIQAAVKFLKQSRPERIMHGTYSVALRACVYAQLPEPMRQRELRDDLRWLQRELIRSGDRRGMYDYGVSGRLGGDYSNSQYGVLGVWYAAQAGLEVPRSYWTQVEGGWLRGQREDGGWGYMPEIDSGRRRWARQSYASMTAAGAATLFITHDYLHANDAAHLDRIKPNEPIERAMKWLGDNFAVEHNAGRDTDLGPQQRPDKDALDIIGELGQIHDGYYVHYMLFAFERVGEASGLTYFGNHKWFDEGADFLIRTQTYEGSWLGRIGSEADTAYALLFLSRGRAPIVIQKLQFEGRWNNRSRDASGFTHFMRRASERHVNWQVVSADAMPAELREAPMLYAASDQPINLTPEQKRRIKTYIEQGGLLVAANEGAGSQFATSIEAMGRELFPNYAFRDLDARHAAFTANFPANQPVAPLRAMSNGLRELIVLYPGGDMPWQWHSTGGGFTPRNTPYASLANLLLYVTDRANPRFKGEETWIERNPGVVPRRIVRVGRVRHDGNWDPEPGGWERLSNIAWNFDQLDARIEPTTTMAPTGGASAPQSPSAPLKTPASAPSAPNHFGLVHLTGTAAISLPDSTRDALRRYLNAGGLLLLDAAGGSPEAAAALEPLLCDLVPDVRIAPLPLDHPIYHGERYGGRTIDHVRYRRNRDLTPIHIPRLRGAMSGGKLVAIVSAEDLSGALVGYSTAGLVGYSPASATEIMQNMLLWRSTASQ